MKRSRIHWLFLGFILLLGACQDTDENANSDDEPENTSENDNAVVEEASGDINGTLWDGGGDIGVIFSHGAAYDADSWEDQGGELEDNGMVAFATEDTAPEELASAADMLEDDYDVDEVALVGASAGGASGIDAITDGDYDFDKAAFLSPGGDATTIDDIPVLVIYSEEEGYEELEDASVETLSIPGSAHAQEMFDEEEGDKVMDKLIEFLEDS